ncbi:hypothetical protein DFH08DRAFT_832050, partial [Mycena albidolilacea]
MLSCITVLRCHRLRLRASADQPAGHLSSEHLRCRGLSLRPHVTYGCLNARSSCVGGGVPNCDEGHNCPTREYSRVCFRVIMWRCVALSGVLCDSTWLPLEIDARARMVTKGLQVASIHRVGHVFQTFLASKRGVTRSWKAAAPPCDAINGSFITIKISLF